jgi:predicted O-methyltransferase YrrM
MCRLAAPDATVISIDLPKPNDTELLAQLEELARPGQKLVCLRDDSHDASTYEKVRRILEGRRLSMLFIDGDHSYSGAKRDYEIYSRLVRPGGIIVLHDIVENLEHPSYGVAQLWKELRPQSDYLEIIDNHHHLTGCGIGILMT